MVRVYSEEIAAFYDTKTETMHLIKEPEAKAKKRPSFLERLLGKTGGLRQGREQDGHRARADARPGRSELRHRRHAEARSRGTTTATWRSRRLIEGEATLTMIGAQMNDWDGSEIAKVPAADLDRVFSLLGPLMPLASGASLREAPPILSETLIFPYLRGLVFCARLTNDGGWKALDAAYREPPLSTEQILHPEKYRAQPDPPMSLDLGKLDAGEGWKELGRNVVGEMQLAVLLRRHGGKPAAAGWDGDRYAVFEGPERPARPGLALDLGHRGGCARVRQGLRPLPDDQGRRRGRRGRRRRPEARQGGRPSSSSGGDRMWWSSKAFRRTRPGPSSKPLSGPRRPR